MVTPDTTFVRRRRIARLICHEISHMWYGDLVTPNSFDELWLKEVRLLRLAPPWRANSFAPNSNGNNAVANGTILETRGETAWHFQCCFFHSRLLINRGVMVHPCC